MPWPSGSINSDQLQQPQPYSTTQILAESSGGVEDLQLLLGLPNNIPLSTSATGLGALLQQQQQQQPVGQSTASPLLQAVLGPPQSECSMVPAGPTSSAQQLVGCDQQLQAMQQLLAQDGLNEDEAQVAALDDIITQCLSQLLQLRNQIASSRGNTAAGTPSMTTAATAPAAPGFAPGGALLYDTGTLRMTMIPQQQQQHQDRTASHLLTGVTAPPCLAPAQQQLVLGDQAVVVVPAGPLSTQSAFVSCSLPAQTGIISSSYTPVPLPDTVVRPSQQQQQLLQPQANLYPAALPFARQATVSADGWGELPATPHFPQQQQYVVLSAPDGCAQPLCSGGGAQLPAGAGVYGLLGMQQQLPSALPGALPGTLPGMLPGQQLHIMQLPH